MSAATALAAASDEPLPKRMCGQPFPCSSHDVMSLSLGFETSAAAVLVAGMLFEPFIVRVYRAGSYMNLRNSSAASLFLLVLLTARPAPAWFDVQCFLPGAHAGFCMILYRSTNDLGAFCTNPCGTQEPPKYM